VQNSFPSLSKLSSEIRLISGVNKRRNMRKRKREARSIAETSRKLIFFLLLFSCALFTSPAFVRRGFKENIARPTIASLQGSDHMGCNLAG
jgi:hypothetical protein